MGVRGRLEGVQGLLLFGRIWVSDGLMYSKLRMGEDFRSSLLSLEFIRVEE